MRRFLGIAFVISVFHFIEDLSLILIGRYTDIHLGIVIVGVVSFGLLIAGLSRITLIKRYLVQ